MFKFEDHLEDTRHIGPVFRSVLVQLMVEGYAVGEYVTNESYLKLDTALKSCRTPSGVSGCSGLESVAALHSHIKLSSRGVEALRHMEALYSSSASNVQIQDMLLAKSLPAIDRQLRKLGSYVYTEIPSAERPLIGSKVSNAVNVAMKSLKLDLAYGNRLKVCVVKVLLPSTKLVHSL